MPWSVVDAFEGFSPLWEAAHAEPLKRQIEVCQEFYGTRFPELLEKQLQDYASQGLDWHKIAEGRIFPHLEGWMPRMRQAHRGLRRLCGPVYERAVRVLGVNLDVIFVIYVGLGCGAGWATRYQGKPACLFGLESIAECGWHTPDKLEGLIAHELGHLVHAAWRGVDELQGFEQDEPWFQLYGEGFAQRCEHIILGRESWHPAQDEGWLPWCQEHRAELTEAFYQRAVAGQSIREFFGSWFEFQGKRQTGYFLGHEFIRWLQRERGLGLQEIARLSLEEIRSQMESHRKAVLEGALRR